MGWIVREVDTGFEDGHYAHLLKAFAARISWDRRRPRHLHVVYHQRDRVITHACYLDYQHPLSEEYNQDSPLEDEFNCPF